MTHLLLAAFLLGADANTTAEWKEFRGPDGSGHYTGPAVPDKWGPDTNVAWTTPIPGKGWSSPILLKGKLYLTSAVTKGEDKKPDYELRAICVDAASGKIDWNELVFTEEAKSAPNIHGKNSHASPSAVTDDERVYFHFGHLGTAAYDLKGKQVWATQKYPYKPVHGGGGSPVLADGRLIVACDGAEKPFVLALNTKDGSEAWKVDRDNTKSAKKFSFTTAQVIEQGKKKLVISQGADVVAAYDVADGKEIWRAGFPTLGYSCICRPVLAGGLVVISTGYDMPQLLAIDPTGSGDVTKTHIKWTHQKHAPNTPTGVAVGDELYTVSDSGVMSCLDAKTGKAHWEEKLKGKGFSASLVVVNGKIYATSEDGKGSVVTPSTKTLEAEDAGDLKEKTFATPLPADGALYLRTESKLYKFASTKK